MPFDFKAYDQKCQGLTLEELQREWEHYTRLISGAATSTAVSGCAIPLTLGVSTIGVAMAAPAIHNARKKREIIERHLNRLNATHHTRKRDVLGSMAVSGTIGVVTLGIGSMGADAVATAGAEHGIQSIVANETAIKLVSHAALDGAGMAVEHKHTDHLKKKDARKAFQKAGVFQAVQDAKAAEAGYSIQPYPNNGQTYPAYAAGSSSQVVPPPPPYNAAVGQTPGPPSYNLNPNGYPQDFKAPVGQSQVPQQNQAHLMPYPAVQQPLQQTYDYSQPHRNSMSAAPSPMPPVNGQMFSPPQTPAMQYPPQSTPAQNVQPLQQQGSYAQQSGVPPYNPTPTPQPFDMSAMHQALPATPAPPTPYQQPQVSQYSNATLPTPSQDAMYQQGQPQATGQIAGAPQAGYFPPVPATPTGYPPAVTVPPQPTAQPVPAVQVPPLMQIPQAPGYVVQHQTSIQQPATPQAQYQQHPGYATPQHTGSYQQPQVPPPPPVDRRSSFMGIHQPTYAPHAPYNPQDWAPKAEQGYVPQPHGMNNTSAQNMPPPMQYQMPPTPLPTGSTITHYQDNKGSYFPISPPATQPQTPQMTGQPPQQYPAVNYPATPMHNPMPVTQ